MGCLGDPRPDGEGCDDADPCTTADACTAGECVGGAAPDCSGLTGACSDGVCDSAGGGCVVRPHADGERCDEALAACEQSLCLGGVCGALTPVDCSAVAGECQIGRCDDVAGCVAEPGPACVVCAGGAGLCDGTGVCRLKAGVEDHFTPGALDAAWSTGGDSGWSRVDLGGPAGGGARSGDIGAREVSEVSRVVDLEADTPISFRYRVSSEATFDFFRFRVDGADVFTASGEVDWSPWNGMVPAGRHTLTFRYDKDGNTESGDDRAEIDDLIVIPVCAQAGDCQKAAAVVGADGGSGGCLTCNAAEGSLCGAGGDACQPGLCVAGACASTPRPDCFSCGSANELCLAGACGVYAQTVFDFEGGFPAGTTHHGEGDWRRVNGQVHGGAQSARSGVILDNEESEMRVPVDLPAPGVLVFWVRTSSESFDRLYVRVDGNEVGRWAGTTNWTRVTSPIAAGAHTLSFSYEKDFSFSSGTDAVWVDDVSITTGDGCP